MASINSTEISCGVTQLNGLSSSDDLEDQISSIIEAFEGSDYGPDPSSQILISDTISSNGWLETKAAAHKGPITINPNTDNKIRVWIITKGTLTKLKKQLAAEAAKKVAKKKPVKKKTSTKKYSF